MYDAFRGAANSLSQLYTHAMNHQRVSFYAGERCGMLKESDLKIQTSSLYQIHGRSRFPGLYIWLRNGEKVAVKVLVGCLLIQTGKQIEWLTGGECIAGMHEVVVTSKTIDAIKLAKEQNRSLWRVSSTLFAHIASDDELKPLGHFAGSSLPSNYPTIPA